MRSKKEATTEPYASSVPRFGPLRRWQRVALALILTLIAMLIGGVLYGAYGYQPPEAGRGYDSPYLQKVGSRFVETLVARFHYVYADDRDAGPRAVGQRRQDPGGLAGGAVRAAHAERAGARIRRVWPRPQI